MTPDGAPPAPRRLHGGVGVCPADRASSRSGDAIRFRVMVSISGGAPSIEADVQLGDVVVSQPRNVSWYGAVQCGQSDAKWVSAGRVPQFSTTTIASSDGHRVSKRGVWHKQAVQAHSEARETWQVFAQQG